jgi:chemotaxis receptor (MCP) glutamine deamidase CheD
VVHGFSDSPVSSIGERNVETARRALATEEIQIAQEEVGGLLGRKIVVDLDDFTVGIKLLRKDRGQ